MKTSNKILLGAFLTALVLLSAVHIAIYARYRSGHYIDLSNPRAQNPDLRRYPLEKIACIRVHNVSVSIHPDKNAAPLMTYSRGEADRYKIEKRGDTLVLSALSKDRNRWYSSVHFYLPGNRTLVLSQASVFLVGEQSDSRDTAAAPSFDLLLDNTELNLGMDNDRVAKPSRFDSLNIVAENQSNLRLGNIELNSLDVRLQRSELKDDGIKAGTFSLRADSASKVTLSGKNLQKVRAAR